MEYQVRNYFVKEGEMEDWLKEWKAQVYPLRNKLGFELVGAWVARGENRFLWILSYDGPMESFSEADKAYYDSEERKSLVPDPARHLAKTEATIMESIL
jgi:hypothetical protein